MTREEAIQRLKANRDAMYFPETVKALDMAIEALSAEPKMKVCEERQNGECPFYTPDWLDDDVSEPSDLISRADAIERFCKFGTSLERQGKTMITMVDAKYAFIETLESLPSADAVEVVRCKDCKHSRVYQTDSKGTMQTYCVAFIMSRTVTDDDFCSWGERREK